VGLECPDLGFPGMSAFTLNAANCLRRNIARAVQGYFRTHSPPQTMSHSITSSASSGESHTFVAGDCLLHDDTSGKGHSTEVLSDVPARWVFIRLSN
jgi:hypothetical protein